MSKEKNWTVGKLIKKLNKLDKDAIVLVSRNLPDEGRAGWDHFGVSEYEANIYQEIDGGKFWQQTNEVEWLDNYRDWVGEEQFKKDNPKYVPKKVVQLFYTECTCGRPH